MASLVLGNELFVIKIEMVKKIFFERYYWATIPYIAQSCRITLKTFCTKCVNGQYCENRSGNLHGVLLITCEFDY